MPYTPFQYNPGLLQTMANPPDESSLQTLTKGLFGQPAAGQGSGIQGAIGQLPQIMQQQRIKQLMNYLQNSQQGNSAFGGNMGGPQNPMMSAMSQNTTMMNDPLGLFGGRGGQ